MNKEKNMDVLQKLPPDAEIEGYVGDKYDGYVRFQAPVRDVRRVVTERIEELRKNNALHIKCPKCEVRVGVPCYSTSDTCKERLALARVSPHLYDREETCTVSVGDVLLSLWCWGDARTAPWYVVNVQFMDTYSLHFDEEEDFRGYVKKLREQVDFLEGLL